jgi:hypothetical protein
MTPGRLSTASGPRGIRAALAALASIKRQRTPSPGQRRHGGRTPDAPGEAPSQPASQGSTYCMCYELVRDMTAAEEIHSRYEINLHLTLLARDPGRAAATGRPRSVSNLVNRPVRISVQKMYS